MFPQDKTLEISSPEKPVYGALATHQRTESWDMRDLLAELHRWAGILNFEFNLQITEVSLSVDYLHPTHLGHFRYGHNGFGLRGETAINRRYLDQRAFWEILGTLCHELLHAWQQAHGKPGKRNYHNKELRDKALSYGLVVDDRGHMQYQPDGPFIRLLQKYGVNVPEIPKPIPLQKRGTSKLKKWSCGCTNIWAAVEINATCLSCGNQFDLL